MIAGMPTDEKFLERLRERLNELNNKSTQVLIFLSFAIAAGALLWTNAPLGNWPKHLAFASMVFWVLAIFPTIFGIWPVQDKWLFDIEVLDKIRWWKVKFLRAAVVCIFLGALCFVSTLVIALV